MIEQPAAALTRLSDTDRTVADPNHDIRGLIVLNAAGQELGKVEDLLVDKKLTVRMLALEQGAILGMGARHLFIPVEAITEINLDEVHVDQSRDPVIDVSPYNPQIV